MSQEKIVWKPDEVFEGSCFGNVLVKQMTTDALIRKEKVSSMLKNKVITLKNEYIEEIQKINPNPVRTYNI